MRHIHGIRVYGMECFSFLISSEVYPVTLFIKRNTILLHIIYGGGYQLLFLLCHQYLEKKGITDTIDERVHIRHKKADMIRIIKQAPKLIK